MVNPEDFPREVRHDRKLLLDGAAGDGTHSDSVLFFPQFLVYNSDDTELSARIRKYGNVLRETLCGFPLHGGSLCHPERLSPRRRGNCGSDADSSSAAADSE